MLGTGNALATRCYNTCFALHSAAGCVLLVDAGGGNGILSQLERAGLRKEEIHDLFVTHAHTDHLLGAIWIVRMALQFRYSLNVWSHAKDRTLETRSERYAREAHEAFAGNIIVPDDLQTVLLD